MKVKELIQKLATMPQDLEVATFDRMDVEWFIVDQVYVRDGWQASPDGAITEGDKFGKVGTTDIRFIGLQ